LAKGIVLGLLKKMNVPELADVIWALVVGMIQLEQMKSSHKKKSDQLRKNMMRFAENLLSKGAA
jgi:hypothetical protein